MQLAEAAQPLAFDTAFWLTGFEASDGFELAELGRISVQLCGKLRALAIIALVVKADSDRFFHNLIRSGTVRETFLARLKQAGHQADHHLASSRLDGLLDAIAAGDIELAQRIAWLSPRQFEPQREYEDDFCYAQVLHRLVHGVSAASVYEPFLARHEAVLQGQPDPRLALCRALVTPSQADFDTAFADLLQARSDEIAAQVARSQLDEPQTVAERQVFVEGLAWLRLAERAGLRTEAEYLYCPSSARVPMRQPLPTPPGT